MLVSLQYIISFLVLPDILQLLLSRCRHFYCFRWTEWKRKVHDSEFYSYNCFWILNGIGMSAKQSTSSEYVPITAESCKMKANTKIILFDMAQTWCSIILDHIGFSFILFRLPGSDCINFIKQKKNQLELRKHICGVESAVLASLNYFVCEMNGKKQKRKREGEKLILWWWRNKLNYRSPSAPYRRQLLLYPFALFLSCMPSFCGLFSY